MPQPFAQALIIFAKRPVAGQVKTRLSPPLSPEEAAGLYACMLRDVIAKAGGFAGIAPLLFYQDEPAAAAWFRRAFPHMALFPQEGADLGERMANAFRLAFALGHRTVVIIGSDSPDLPVEYLRQACRLLEEGDAEAVFGPSEDGGYYLLGMKRLWPELFTGIEWSTAAVLAESLARGAAAGIRTALLPSWHDVDTAEDLLRPELRDEQNEAPLTRRFIEKLLRNNKS